MLSDVFDLQLYDICIVRALNAYAYTAYTLPFTPGLNATPSALCCLYNLYSNSKFIVCIVMSSCHDYSILHFDNIQCVSWFEIWNFWIRSKYFLVGDQIIRSYFFVLFPWFRKPKRLHLFTYYVEFITNPVAMSDARSYGDPTLDGDLTSINYRSIKCCIW